VLKPGVDALYSISEDFIDLTEVVSGFHWPPLYLYSTTVSLSTPFEDSQEIGTSNSMVTPSRLVPRFFGEISTYWKTVPEGFVVIVLGFALRLLTPISALVSSTSLERVIAERAIFSLLMYMVTGEFAERELHTLEVDAAVFVVGAAPGKDPPPEELELDELEEAAALVVKLTLLLDTQLPA
jgi:hypothetical protein